MSNPLVKAEPCATAPRTMTVQAAHAAMQDHLTCRTDLCARRRTARQVLVDAGEYLLADDAPSQPRPRGTR